MESSEQYISLLVGVVLLLGGAVIRNLLTRMRKVEDGLENHQNSCTRRYEDTAKLTAQMIAKLDTLRDGQSETVKQIRDLGEGNRKAHEFLHDRVGKVERAIVRVETKLER